MSVNAEQADGATPLYTAAYSGYTEAVELLLDHNADVSVKSRDGQLPIDAARQCRHFDVVKLLQ